LYRFTKNFITGAIEKDGDCAEGVSRIPNHAKNGAVL
jgi:hypothetical protein